MSTNENTEADGTSRRAVLAGAVWSAPTIVLATAAPVLAASGPPCPVSLFAASAERNKDNHNHVSVNFHFKPHDIPVEIIQIDYANGTNLWKGTAGPLPKNVKVDVGNVPAYSGVLIVTVIVNGHTYVQTVATSWK